MPYHPHIARRPNLRAIRRTRAARISAIVNGAAFTFCLLAFGAIVALHAAYIVVTFARPF